VRFAEDCFTTEKRKHPSCLVGEIILAPLWFIAPQCSSQPSQPAVRLNALRIQPIEQRRQLRRLTQQITESIAIARATDLKRSFAGYPIFREHQSALPTRYYDLHSNHNQAI
jgi:hypothetical protein